MPNLHLKKSINRGKIRNRSSTLYGRLDPCIVIVFTIHCEYYAIAIGFCNVEMIIALSGKGTLCRASLADGSFR